MKLIIGGPIPQGEPIKDSYVIKIEFMEGDADGYQSQEIVFSRDTPIEEVERFINFLDACANHYKHGKGGYDDYTEVKDYYYFVGNGDDYDLDDEDFDGEPEEPSEHFCLEYWPSDRDGCVTSFEEYSITYFDHAGNEREVEIKR